MQVLAPVTNRGEAIGVLELRLPEAPAEQTLAGWLEPAGDNAGDTFDFALERDVLHLSLTGTVLEAVDGDLKDDATTLCLDWHGGPERERSSSGGANR